MMLLDEYNSTLDAWAAAERALADKARAGEDERERSLCLMRANMFGEMLKSLGKVEHQGMRPGILAREASFLKEESARLKSLGDYDAAERALVKATAIERAAGLLRELEGRA